MRRNPSESHLEKAKRLSKEEFERLVSSPRTRSLKKSHKGLSALEYVALQLELDDEDLMEWRTKAAEMRARWEEKAHPTTVHM